MNTPSRGGNGGGAADDTAIPIHPHADVREPSQQAPSNGANNTYLSSQIRALYHIQQFLSHQLQQARLDPNDNADNELEEVSVDANEGPAAPINSRQSNNVDLDSSSDSLYEHHDNNSAGNREISLDESVIVPGNTRMDLQMFTRWLEQAIPFLILLLVLWAYQHRMGILILMWNTTVFMHSNQALRRQVALKDKRKVNALAAVIVGLVSHIFFMYFILRSEELWRYLVLLPPKKPLNFLNAFWIVIVNDFFVRFLTMIAKAAVIIAVGHKPPYKRKSQLYTLIEMTSYTYRTVLPIPIWFQYFYMAEDGGASGGHVFSVFIAGVYLALKVTNILEKLKQFVAIVRAYIAREVPFGKYASPEQVTEDMCSICQEKMTSPIILSCQHVFCEDCVSEWFERERTCPLCRAPIRHAGNRTHSDGSTSVLAQIF